MESDSVKLLRANDKWVQRKSPLASGGVGTWEDAGQEGKMEREPGLPPPLDPGCFCPPRDQQRFGFLQQQWAGARVGGCM